MDALKRNLSGLELKAWNHGQTCLHQVNQISFNGNVRMGSYKVFVIKSDMPDDSKTVGNDAKFEDITEMPIDV